MENKRLSTNELLNKNNNNNNNNNKAKHINELYQAQGANKQPTSNKKSNNALINSNNNLKQQLEPKSLYKDIVIRNEDVEEYEDELEL